MIFCHNNCQNDLMILRHNNFNLLLANLLLSQKKPFEGVQ